MCLYVLVEPPPNFSFGGGHGICVWNAGPPCSLLELSWTVAGTRPVVSSLLVLATGSVASLSLFSHGFYTSSWSTTGDLLVGALWLLLRGCKSLHGPRWCWWPPQFHDPLVHVFASPELYEGAVGGGGARFPQPLNGPINAHDIGLVIGCRENDLSTNLTCI